jgi:hypothetical protein
MWEEKRQEYRVLLGNLKECVHLIDLGVDRKIILKLNVNEKDGRTCFGLI